MSRICVVGGTGLLGASLVPELRVQGYKVMCLSRQVKNDNNLIVDYFNSSSMELALDELKPSLIINLAALTNVDECEKNPQNAYMSNVKIVQNLTRWIRKTQKCHLIHISTDHVYDGLGPHIEANINIVNYYAFSKLSGELAASRVPSTILRTNFFGKSNSINRLSFSDWIYRSLLGKDKIEAFSDVYFSPISIESLIYYINLVLQKPINGIFNLGSREGFSKADFIHTFAEKLNIGTENVSNISFKDKKLKAPRPMDMRMDCSKFELAYNCGPMPTLKDQIDLISGDYLNAIE